MKLVDDIPEPPPISDEEFDRDLGEPPIPWRQFRDASEYLDGIDDYQVTAAARAMPWGIKFLDDYFRHLYATDLAIVSADTGAGKTTLATQLARGACQQGKRVAFFALEAHTGEIQHRMVYAEVNRMAWNLRVPGHELLTFGEWINGQCSTEIYALNAEAIRRVAEETKDRLLMRYRGMRFTAKNIEHEFVAVGREVDLLILDHVHYVDGDSDDENKAMTEVAKALRSVALEVERPVIAVAHLRKRGAGTKQGGLVPRVEEIHGSSNLPKIATRIVTLAPFPERGGLPSHIAPTLMRACKCRWDGVKEYVAFLQFNLNRQQYEERYGLGRLVKGGSEWKPLWRHEVPAWCPYEDTHPVESSAPKEEYE